MHIYKQQSNWRWKLKKYLGKNKGDTYSERMRREEKHKREECTLERERRATERALEKARKAVDRESIQVLRKEKVAEKAAQKRQGRRRRNEDLLGSAEGDEQPIGGSAAVTTGGSIVSTTEATPNAEWASAFRLQHSCPTVGAFSQYAVPSSL
jgi:hypothetical protein